MNFFLSGWMERLVSGPSDNQQATNMPKWRQSTRLAPPHRVPALVLSVYCQKFFKLKFFRRICPWIWWNYDVINCAGSNNLTDHLWWKLEVLSEKSIFIKCQHERLTVSHWKNWRFLEKSVRQKINFVGKYYLVIVLQG